jgi:signal transduction histidine kinase
VGTLRGDDLPGPDALAPDARLALYRTAQEALTNVRRHARPSQVDVRLRWERAGAELTVENDGAGEGEPGPAARKGAGYGLTGMRERAELLGDSLEVRGGDGRFRVRLWVPAALTSG